MELKVDWYTKFILTVIAVSLIGLLLKPLLSPQPVSAGYREIQDVNIAKIDRRYISWATPINVQLKIR